MAFQNPFRAPHLYNLVQKLISNQCCQLSVNHVPLQANLNEFVYFMCQGFSVHFFNSVCRVI